MGTDVVKCPNLAQHVPAGTRRWVDAPRQPGAQDLRRHWRKLVGNEADAHVVLGVSHRVGELRSTARVEA